MFQGKFKGNPRGKLSLCMRATAKTEILVTFNTTYRLLSVWNPYICFMERIKLFKVFIAVKRMSDQPFFRLLS